ncbi:MAG: 23S rRNA (pseudouridine(1915)-N(3))-methyltransferase RlmH [Clostridia bacterium]|nr:23S rRNA (pseudouridine(1915)-N(3))-methyltransferase RlmH [Clostridia bacterium]
MRITLLYVGSTSERFYSEAAAEYEKRIGGFASFNSICIKEERIGDEASEAVVAKCLAAEEQRIRAAIPKGAFTVALCIEGKQLSSEELAAKFSDLGTGGTSTVVFIIGSSHGISPSLKASCNMRISMSKMTFPHMLARVMLTEQIYRAFTIIADKKYHK